jgi:galactose mutarotase-like enzyme
MREKLENDLLSITADNSGAELRSLFYKPEQKEFLWQGNAAWWPRSAPILFPIVGKLNNNTYRFKGITYQLPQHGFARDHEFLLTEKHTNKIVFTLHSNEATLKAYPFEFVLLISYELFGNRLITSYEVKNTGKQDMYFSIGAHPGFNCPFNNNEHFSDYFLEFEKEETLDRYLLNEGTFKGNTERVMTSTKILPLHEELFLKDAIVFKNMQSTFVNLKSKLSGSSLKFEFKDFPYFGIWTKPGATFICLEPWCGIADNKDFNGDLKEKEGIIRLPQGNNFIRSYSIEINH